MNFGLLFLHQIKVLIEQLRTERMVCHALAHLQWLVLRNGGAYFLYHWYIDSMYVLVVASISEPHTSGSQFNCGMMVVFPKVYTMNKESPTLSVVRG